MSEIFSEVMLEYVPPETKRKLLSLVDERVIVWGALRSVTHDLEAAWENRGLAERSLQRSLVTPEDASRRMGADERFALEGPLRRIDSEIANRLKPRVERAQAAFDEWAFLEQTKYWLFEAMERRARLTFIASEKPRSGDHRGIVSGARKRLIEIDDELQRVSAAPMPLSDMRQAVIDHVDGFSREPHVALNARENSPVQFVHRLAAPSSRNGQQWNPLPVMVWLCRDAIIARALSLLPESDPEGCMSGTARDEALTRLAAEKLRLEREEEAAIVAAGVAGIPIARRRDADPRAILEVTER